MGSSKAESASATYVNARPERSNLIVCGVGGSGTRAVVQALQALDPREQLEDRNEADDTLAATLLFKHRCALEHSGVRGFDACWRDLQMALDHKGAEANLETTFRLFRLALADRPLNARKWYLGRAWRLRREMAVRNDGRRATWLVKEPNLQMFVEPILKSRQDVEVVVIVRNGLDMAFSRNQQQLVTWGDGATGPIASLEHWCRAHERLFDVAGRYSGRVHFLGFELLCRDPTEGGRSLARVLPGVDRSSIEQTVDQVFEAPASIGRHRNEDCSMMPMPLRARVDEMMKQVESGGAPGATRS